ncbi:ribonuclease H-like protein [Colletotrichum sublineola]|nr:ribonuclease H-like protein [Colletotrichum sublineola]
MAFANTTEMTLPNGNSVTVCASHQQVVCGWCCVDFSFDLNDGECISSDDEGVFGMDASGLLPWDVSFAQVAASKFGRRKQGGASPTRDPARRGNILSMPLGVNDEIIRLNGVSPRPAVPSVIFPGRFSPPGRGPLQPLDLFPPGHHRFVNQHDDSEMLVFVDGACSNNGSPNAVGGCGFVFKSREGGSISFRLEGRGADGRAYQMTSNRAELRAALAVLKFRAWDGEGFQSVVVATDSEYVASGATDWIRGWVEKGWRSSKGGPVKNRDLWEALLLRIRELHREGYQVAFWRIPREWNVEAY